MDILIFACLAFFLQFVYWFVSRRALKNVSDKEDYFLAGKNVQFFPLMMTFAATVMGGGLFLGAAEDAYRFGWPVILYPLGSAIGMMLVGAGIGRRLAGFQVSTVAQIFELVYQSKLLKWVASSLSVVALFMILIAQIVASSKFLVSMGLSNTPFFLGFWAVVILYTVQGGLRAVILTDTVQAAFFSCVFLFCCGFVLVLNPSSATLQLPQMENFAAVSSKLCGWLIMPLLWMIIGQDQGQRCFAGGSPKIVSRASFSAGVLIMIVCVVPVFFGCLARAMGLEVPEGSSVLMTVIAATTNPWISALVGCAVLAAIISTATSLINAIGSNISNDFQFPVVEKSAALRIVRTLTFVISTAAIFSALYFDNIVDILLLTYELSISCTFIPIAMALIRRRGTFLAGLFSILFGAGGFILFRMIPIEFPREIASVILSFVGYGCGEVLAFFTLGAMDNKALESDMG